MSSISLSPGLLSVGHLKFANFWLALGAALIAFVAVMSLISVPQQMQAIIINDKLAHVAVYGGLMGWFAQIFRNDITRGLLLIAFVALGVAMEYLQSMVPSRQFEVLDMVANTCGILLAWALAYTWMGGLLQWFENTMLDWVPQSA